GTFKQGQNVTHTFSTPGLKTVCLTVVTVDRCTSTQCTFVSVTPPQNCQANFIYTRQGNTVAFQNTSQGAAPLTYNWTFGDGTTSTEANPSKTYRNPGRYAVCLTVRDAFGCSKMHCDSVLISSTTSCQANFTFSVRDNRVVFANSSQGAIPITYFWTFGDGTTSNLENPQKTYSASGDYLTCLRIATGDGCTATKCDTVRVRMAPPCEADFEVIDSAGRFFFINRSRGEIARVRWSFGDGTFSSEMNPTKVYAQPGTYSVTLTIFGTNCQKTVTKPVTVRPSNPVPCRADYRYRIEGTNVIFENLSQGPEPLTYNWTAWYNGQTQTSTQKNPTFNFSGSGSVMVCLNISSADRTCRQSKCDTIIIPELPPCVANFTHKDSVGYTFFYDLSQGNITSWQWDFGDGNTSTLRNPIHYYQFPGTYAVTLTISGPNCRQRVSRAILIPPRGGNKIAGCLYSMVDTLLYAAQVYLIKYDSIQGTLTAVDSVVVSSYTSQLCYSFNNVPNGKYLVKAALLPVGPAFANNLPTYYGNVLYWNQATYVTVPPSFYTANITFVPGQNNGGPGFVGGYVSQGANKVANAISNAQGATVILKGNENDVMLYAVPDKEGKFELSNLPHGSYTLTADVLGQYTKPQTIQVSAQNTVQKGIQLVVSKNLATTLGDVEASLYPNPVKETATLTFNQVSGSQYCVEVLSLMGQRVLRSCTVSQETKDAIIEIPTQGIPAGSYVLSIQVEGSPVWSQKFVKVD
ncbi:MAG: PKD domain-containing protein, partial [Bacteroidia bacterium]|nr:PKD domain-containing protein [Bacteroidia bacterium]